MVSIVGEAVSSCVFDNSFVDWSQGNLLFCAMEKELELRLKEIEGSENVIGYMVTDKQGLCLAASQNLKHEVAGLISTIAREAAKIENGDDHPVILLENDTRQCLIHENDGVAMAIFKKI